MYQDILNAANNLLNLLVKEREEYVLEPDSELILSIVNCEIKMIEQVIKRTRLTIKVKEAGKALLDLPSLFDKE